MKPIRKWNDQNKLQQSPIDERNVDNPARDFSVSLFYLCKSASKQRLKKVLLPLYPQEKEL
ncbi:hypothetical protein [Holdemania filiformis]|uniref:hypothetical protein n=1 Tax=Holdemania filiformis TaxID=61171 RepID=UPI0011C142D4|nr:hypothetical protein [Holdemania filiformis]MBS5003214.1 hypothetical protein [Holdemania filiformis]